jgi:ATP-dependent Zn protease
MSEIVAYHEAGHVLLAMLLGGRVRSVTIEPDRDDGPERYGDTQILWPRGRWSAREQAEKDVQVALAGPVAEMIHTGDPFHPGFVAEWSADWQAAWASAALLAADEVKRLRYLEQISLQLHRQLSRDDHWAALAAIVDHLLAHETLEGEQVEEVLEWFLRHHL